MRRLTPRYPRQQKHKQRNARMPSASSNSGAECRDAAASVQSVSSANCMQKDEEPFDCSNQCWEILRQHVKGGRGRRKSPLGLKEAKESSPVIAMFSLQDQQVLRLFFPLNLTELFPMQRSDCPVYTNTCVK